MLSRPQWGYLFVQENTWRRLLLARSVETVSLTGHYKNITRNIVTRLHCRRLSLSLSLYSSHAVTADLSISEVAQAADFFLSDGVIVTGRSTGCPASQCEVREVKTSTSLPLLIGSGVSPENVDSYSTLADGLIIGSWFKKEGVWFNPIDPNRVSIFMETLLSL